MKRPCPLDATDLSKAMRNYARISLLLVTVFNSNGDTKVILTAYMHWGTDCLHRFNGMWALAIASAEREFATAIAFPRRIVRSIGESEAEIKAPGITVVQILDVSNHSGPQAETA
jgi:hypothetical protein